MRPERLAALFLGLALVAPPPASAQAPDPAPNAALMYWQAFALLPALDNDQEKLLQGWNKAPLDAPAMKLLDRSRESLAYLQRASKLPRCDWGLDYRDGLRLLLPHGPRSMTLARLAALHARHEFEQGHWQAGWDDVAATLKLGRDVGTCPLFILRMVDDRIESMAVEAAAPYLPGLKSDHPGAALDALPAGPTLSQMVLAEKQVGAVWMIRELKEAEGRKKGSWQGVWNEILGAPGDGEAVNRDVVQSARTFEQAVKMLEDLLPLYDELAGLAALPWKEFDARYPEFVRKARAGNKAAGYVLPDLAKVVPVERRTQTLLAMFKAALAVVQGGQDRLGGIKDPYGDGPFEYQAMGDGFELRSKLIYKGRPVTLTVGKGRKG